MQIHYLSPLRREAKWNWAALVRRWSSSSFISQLVNATYSVPAATALCSRLLATDIISHYLQNGALLRKNTGTTPARASVDVPLKSEGSVFCHLIPHTLVFETGHRESGASMCCMCMQFITHTCLASVSGALHMVCLNAEIKAMV